jgi:hypothetical protein
MSARVLMRRLQFAIYSPNGGHKVWLGSLLWNKWLAPQNNWNGSVLDIHISAAGEIR